MRKSWPPWRGGNPSISISFYEFTRWSPYMFSWYHHCCWWNPNLFMRSCSSATSRCPEVFQGATDRCSWSAAGGSDGEDRVERNELGLSERSAGNPRGNGAWNGDGCWVKMVEMFRRKSSKYLWVLTFFWGLWFRKVCPFSASTWKNL